MENQKKLHTQNKSEVVMKAALVVLVAGIMLSGCTEQARVKSFGGTTAIDLPKGQEFLHATWKETDLWYATRPRVAGEKPDSIRFTESSSYGVMEGTIIFVEH